ncbi:MAG: VIT1/CCC1 transporter family protein [Actinomycetes bacterium]
MPSPTPPPPPASTGPAPSPGSRRSRAARFREHLAAERQAAELYRRLAGSATGEQRDALLELVDVELGHAAHWEDKLRELGEPVPDPARFRAQLRTRVLGQAAQRLGLRRVLPVVERAERADAGTYDQDPDATATMAADERGHAQVLSSIVDGTIRDDTEQLRGAAAIAAREPWHRADRSGSVRAAVFGVSDGLVSNTALVMGFAGSGVGTRTVLFAGLAGLMAGSFSMAAGEYVSIASQKEMYEREIDLERRELEEKPEEERAELVLIYRAKGLPRDEAERLADRIMTDPDVALNTLAREELGLDPEDLGSPWGAAASSFLAFALGAFVVVLPYLVASGRTALILAIGLAVAALLAVGVGVGVLGGRAPWRSAARQLLVGGLAASATYLIGALIGVSGAS